MDLILVAAASFEERSLVVPRKFVDDEGSGEGVHLANVLEDNPEYRHNLEELRKLGIESVREVDRLSSRSMWSWAWSTIGEAQGDVVVDASCMPRELLGMVLFAISVRRGQLGRVVVRYVAAPEGGYATENPKLDEEDQWLSRGVVRVRSIVGYPGNFASHRRCHVVALTGHELERVLEVVETYEPEKVRIGTQRRSATGSGGASYWSKRVAEELKDRVEVPEFEEFEFGAHSIDDVARQLGELGLQSSGANVALVSMNTKLSFIGSALFGLQFRSIRLVYAVPREYNPRYCEGVGELHEVDITEHIRAAMTDEALP